VPDTNTVSKPYSVSGENFTGTGKGIWLDDRYASANNYKVGDTIILTIEGITIEEIIKGTVYSPEYVYMEDENSSVPDFSKKGFAYVTKEEYTMVPFTQIVITTNVPDVNALEEKIETIVTSNISVYLPRENHSSFITFNAEIEQHQAMGAIFPVVFLAVALLTMLTTMTRIVNNQRTQIGTLKALGFKKKKIMRHYVFYGFFLSTIGSVLGLLLGPLLLPPLFYPSMSSFYTLPSWQPGYEFSFYIMALLTIVLTTLTTYFACYKVLKENPAKTLRPKAPKTAKKGILEKIPFWHKTSFVTRWNYRDIMRNKVRSIMAVVGVLGCTALLVAAFGMKADMDDLRDWQYEKINQFSSKLNIDEMATPELIKSAKEAVNGEYLLEGAVEIRTEDKKKTGSITVLDDGNLLQYTDVNVKNIDLPKNGLSISYKIANELGVKVGDTIEWYMYGDTSWKTSIVETIYRHPTSQGISIYKEYYEDCGYTFTPTAILTTEDVTKTYDGIASVMNNVDIISGWDELTEAMLLMVTILIVAAVVLAIVVLYNLGILSLTEMKRDLATLKVVGFKTKKLQKLMLIQNIWLSLIGFMIGIPLGKWLIDVMIESMGSSMDMTNIIHLPTIVISFVIVIVLAILVNIMFYKKLKNVDMVAALKGVE
ncbi:MAG: FtsX-like permease family protein, partial [Coprobacillaceae bacterium]